MKKLLPLTFLLFLTACSEMSFTYNGLQCPTDDMNVISADLQECRVYDIKDVDKALKKDQKCQKCLEDKGYIIKAITDNNASK